MEIHNGEIRRQGKQYDKKKVAYKKMCKNVLFEKNRN